MNCKSMIRNCAAVGAVWALCALSLTAVRVDPAKAQPRRVVSINLCTDQLLMALADPVQIAGLSRFAGHPEMSYLAAQARAFPILRPGAESVVKLAPDMVLGGTFSGTATRAWLTALGYRVETFTPPRSIAEATAEIERAARLLGQVGRGETLIARINRAADTRAGGVALTALALQRRGYASGRDTVLSDVMRIAGLSNAAAAFGLTAGGRVPMEVVLKSRPSVLVLEDIGARPRDQATALLEHAALIRLYPAERRIAVPVAEATCGGPALPALIERFQRATALLRGGY